MKIYKVVIEIGFDLSVPESKIKESIIQAVYEDIPEVKLFRLDEFKPINTASGQYRLAVDEAERLNLNDQNLKNKNS